MCFRHSHLAYGTGGAKHKTSGWAMGRPLHCQVERLRQPGRQKEKTWGPKTSKARRCSSRCSSSESRPEEEGWWKRQGKEQQRRFRRRWFSGCCKSGVSLDLLHDHSVAGCDDATEPPCRPVTSQDDPSDVLTSLTTTSPGRELRTDEQVDLASACPTDSTAAAVHDNKFERYDKSGLPKRHDPPGSKASTVKAERLLNSQIRWILSSPSVSLRRFFHSTFASQAGKVEPCSLRSVWPLPLPARRGRGSTAADQCLNSMVVVLNWLHLGQPCKVPSNYNAASTLTGEQKGIVARLR